MTSDMPALDLRAAKRQFSRIGFALLTFWLMTMAVQVLYGVAAELLPFVPKISRSVKLAMLVSEFSMYAFGLPACLLVLHGTEKSAPVREKVSLSTVAVSVCIALAFLYIGNSISLTFLSWFETVTGRLPENTASELLGALPWYWEVFFAVIFAPIAEEFLFRKVLLDRTRMYGEKTAILFSALMFGFFHMSLYQFFYATLIGLLLGYLYLRTGKLWVTVIVHSVINFIGSTLPLLLINGVDLEEFFELYETADADALLQYAAENAAGIMTLFLFGLFVFAVNIVGVIFFAKRVGKLRFYPAEKDLPRGEEATVAFAGIGVIIYIVFTSLYPFVEMLL